MKLTRIAVALAAVALMAGMAPAAVADDGSTHLDSLQASRQGDNLFVSGSATFVDQPAQIGEDPSGDATVAGVGADVTTMTASRANPAGSSITLSFGIADAPAEVNGSPQTIYIWPLAVNGVDEQFYLEARLVSTVFPTATTPTFKLMQDSPDGFLDIANLTGTMDGSKVSFNLPLFRIGAEGGDSLGQGAAGGGMGSTFAIPGALRFNGNLLGDGAFLDGDYEIPEATVSFGLAEVGTPPALVATPHEAAVNAGTGEFNGAVNVAETAAGEYQLVVKACYGSGNCETNSSTVTI